MVHRVVQRGHLRRGGQAVRVGVEAAVGASRVSEASDAGQSRAGAGKAGDGSIRAALVFVEGVAEGSLIWQSAVVRSQPAQEEPGVDSLADAFQLFLPARPVLVVGVVLHVLHPKPLCFLNIGPLLRGSEGLP